MEELREKFLGKNKITNWADCEDSDSLPSSHDDLAETVTQAVSVDGSKSSKNAKASNAKKAAAGPNPRLFQGALRGIVDQKQPMTRPPASNNHSNGSQSSQSSRHRSNSRPTASNFDQQQPAEADIRESQPKANGKIPLQSIDQKQLIKHAEALKQTIVTFQAPTLKRLNEIIDVIHQHTSVTLQFILWRRTIDVPSQGKRNPIVVIRYTRKELAQLIRMACKAFVEQTKAKDFDYGPVDSQLEGNALDITELGRKVFRSERGLDDLFERENIPGFIPLLLFVMDFATKRLGRDLEFYFDEWLKEPLVAERNRPFLQCLEDGQPVLRQLDFWGCGVEGLKHQQSLHKFTQPSSHLQNGDAVEWMRSILVLQLKRLDGESVNKIRGLQELLLNGGSVFDPMKEIMADESKVVGNELTARNINSATAGKDGFNWVRVVKRHQDNYLVLLKFQSTKSREAAFNSLKAFSGDLTYFGPSDKEISSFSASQPPSACIKQVLEGKLPMDAVWKSEKFCGLIRLYFEVLKTGGDCYDSLLNNQRYGLDGRLQALAYLTLLLDDN